MVVILLADGFEEVEALAPADILRRMGLSVVLAGISGRQVTGAHGIVITADKTLNQIKKETPAMVILPGGMPGAKNLAASSAVADLLLKTHKAGGVLGAICAAPMVLGKLGLLQGKKATCYPGFEEDLTGAEVLPKEKLVVDGNIVTARSAGAVMDFGFALGALLKDEAEAKFVRRSMFIE
jgi:4-methyl-5(b-hydroxyethyl)-thiazole monophosphate biosynthesis